MIGMVSNEGLRYFQVQITTEQGSKMPGISILDHFSKVEIITSVDTSKWPATYLCLITYEDENIFEGGLNLDLSFQIEKIVLKFQYHAYIVARVTGPIMTMVQAVENCWLTTPTSLTRDQGLFMTVQGTPKALKEARDELQRIIPEVLKMRISKTIAADWISAPKLPKRRHEVMRTAVELGYYSTPRKCTQRDIADHLGIRQGTVAEHLQSAEGIIIQSWFQQTSDSTLE